MVRINERATNEIGRRIIVEINSSYELLIAINCRNNMQKLLSSRRIVYLILMYCLEDCK